METLIPIGGSFDVAHTLRGSGFDASEDGTGRGTPLVPVSVAMRGRDGGAELEVGDDQAFALRASQGGGDKPMVFVPVDITNGRIGSQILGTLEASQNKGNKGLEVLAFTSKDHGADAGELAPTLRSGGFTTSHANGGVMPAIAFHHTQDPISGAESPCLGAKVDGMGVFAASAVRRLTPRECERLQGFPDDYTAIPGASDSARYHALGNSMAVPCMRRIGERIQRVDALLEVA